MEKYKKTEKKAYLKLWQACEVGDFDKAKNVIEKVSDINKPNEFGWNAIIIAAYNHSYEVIDLLLSAGADINSTNEKGTSVFMYAKTRVFENRNFSFLEKLLSQGADINHRDKLNNLTVLDYVKLKNDKEMIDFMISNNAV